MIDKAQLLSILHIGHDSSRRGEGISIRDAILRTNYKGLRHGFGVTELVPLIQANSELAKQWILFCEDKRTNGGFWINADSFEVGALETHQSSVRYSSLEEAVAEFVIRELDFWSGVTDIPTHR